MELTSPCNDELRGICVSFMLGTAVGQMVAPKKDMSTSSPRNLRVSPCL